MLTEPTINTETETETETEDGIVIVETNNDDVVVVAAPEETARDNNNGVVEEVVVHDEHMVGEILGDVELAERMEELFEDTSPNSTPKDDDDDDALVAKEGNRQDDTIVGDTSTATDVAKNVEDTTGATPAAVDGGTPVNANKGTEETCEEASKQMEPEEDARAGDGKKEKEDDDAAIGVVTELANVVAVDAPELVEGEETNGGGALNRFMGFVKKTADVPGFMGSFLSTSDVPNTCIISEATVNSGDPTKSRRISMIAVHAGNVVDGISIKYANTTSAEETSMHNHGSDGGVADILYLEEDEYVNHIELRYGRFVQRVTFITNKLRTLGPCGGEGGLFLGRKGKETILQAPENCKLVGIFGRNGKFMDQLGFHWGPISISKNVEASDTVFYSTHPFGGQGGGSFDDGHY